MASYPPRARQRVSSSVAITRRLLASVFAGLLIFSFWVVVYFNDDDNTQLGRLAFALRNQYRRGKHGPTNLPQGQVRHNVGDFSEKEIAIVGDLEWDGGIYDTMWARPFPVCMGKTCGYKLNITCPLRREKNHLIVLLWNTVFGVGMFHDERTVANFQCCDGVVWSYTQDKNLLAQADIVEFHFFARDMKDVTLPRLQPWQLVAIFTGEANPVVAAQRRLLVMGVNVMRSQSLDADLWHSFESIGDCYVGEVRRSLEPPYGNRSDTPVAALVRNCKAHSGRTYLLVGLYRTLPVHSFGQCMHNRRIPGQDNGDSSFLKFYKFLFSVENRLCRHYVTEKWSRNFKLGTIPIVASYRDSYPDYEARAPAPGSFVNAFDYRSVRELAYHLGNVADDRKVFDAYHSFRGDAGTVSPRFLRRYERGDDIGGWCALAKNMRNATTMQHLQQRHLTEDEINGCIQQAGILETIPY